MRKLGYVLVLIVCLGAGLGVGILKRQRRNHAGAGDGLTIGGPKSPDTNSLLADAASSTAGTAETPATDAAATSAMTPETAAATPESLDPAAGRTFAGGANSDPVAPSGDSGSSSGSSGKKHRGGDTMMASSEPSSDSGSGSSSVSDLPPTADNVVIDGASKGNEVFDNPMPSTSKSSKSSKSKKGTAVASTAPVAPASSGDDLNDLPVIDDPAAGSAPAKDDWGSTASTPAPAAAKNEPPPAPPDQVAMINNSPGDLTFPSGSGAALRKITQRQNGDKSVVRIERSGSNKYQVFKLNKPSRVWIDFEETSVPGGDPQPVGGSAHVKEISARYIKNSGGGIPRARVQILLTDEKIPNVACEDAGGGVECTIGGAAEKF